MNDSPLPGLDVAMLESWLREHHPRLIGDGALSASLITGGLSNLSYAVDAGESRWVLRRPPLGHVLSTAHDMGREHRVITALRTSGVPVPIAHVHHVDEDGSAGVGAEFYIMDRVPGATISSTEDNAFFTPAQLAELGPALARVLAALHAVDWQEAGLVGFGRPDGYLGRQLSRWQRQLDQSRSRAVPALDDLAARISPLLPETTATSIVHGDYRLDNTLIGLHAGRPVVTAVLDWEMATIGDSFTDLGMFGVYWDLHSLPGAAGSPLASAIDPGAGYPSFERVVHEYSEARGAAVPGLSWYLAFASFKLGVILEGIHYRFTRGQTVGDGFDRVGRLVEPLAARGLDYLETGRADA